MAPEALNLSFLAVYSHNLALFWPLFFFLEASKWSQILANSLKWKFLSFLTIFEQNNDLESKKRVPEALTLSPPRGGEISPPPTKIESYSLMDVSIFFNFWLFFKLIPLTNPSKVRFLVYYKKTSEIWDQRFLVSLFLG